MLIDEIVSAIRDKGITTDFTPIKDEWIADVDERYPGMPSDIRYFYQNYGYGSFGASRYAVHCLLDPGEIYDPETAKNLQGIIIVGDDFAGNCEAYDAANGWRFGYIGSDGEFVPYDGVYSSFSDFLTKWFLSDDD